MIRQARGNSLSGIPASTFRCADDQLVAGAASAGFEFLQNPTCQQLVDVSRRRVWGALGDGCPLFAGELAVEAIRSRFSSFD